MFTPIFRKRKRKRKQVNVNVNVNRPEDPDFRKRKRKRKRRKQALFTNVFTNRKSTDNASPSAPHTLAPAP